MDPKTELAALRQEIDQADAQILAQFTRRQEVADRVAEVKRAANLAIDDPGREALVLAAAQERAPGELHGDVAILMNTLMALSKRRQRTHLLRAEEVPLPPPARPANTLAAYQGVPGAWGEQAAALLFPGRELMNYTFFEDVFDAVKSGKTGYGVLPIENTQTGAVGEVYDLLRRHGCYIVAQAWVEIRQCLLARQGTALTDVREVLSKPEGFGQCRSFLYGRAWDQVACSNTAAAAEAVAARQDKRAAAIGSRRAAELYGLEVLAPDIMDRADNKTRFIAVAKEPWYDETCDTIGVTFSTAHRAGALCSVLQAFMAAGVNLTRIESRPTTGGKYRFFADLQANILDEAVRATLSQASALSEYFEVLGCYKA